jgi:hypothetical protein
VDDRQVRARRAQARGRVAGAGVGAVPRLDAGHIRQEKVGQARAPGQCPDLARVKSDRKTAHPSERPPATEAELRAEQMARLREEVRRR